MARTVRQISVEDVKKIAYQLAIDLEWEEKIPPFETRSPGKLEGALAAPFHTFQGQSPYKGVINKAAALFYFIVKDHPFQNGNKRIGLTTVLVYLYRNGYWIDTSPQTLYELAIWIAASPSSARDEAIKTLASLLNKYKFKIHQD